MSCKEKRRYSQGFLGTVERNYFFANTFLSPTGDALQIGQISKSCSKGTTMMKRLIAPGFIGVGLVLALSSCTNPYDPGQRAVGGGLLGAGAGAAVGGAVGGGHGAAVGAAIGGATGAVTGAATTPPPPPPPGYQSGYRPSY
jgi:hypothetical protein